MKVLHIIPAYYPATYWGGPIYSVYGLCNALAKISNLALKVLTTDAAGPRRCDSVKITEIPMIYPPGYKVFCFRRRWGSSASPDMFIRLLPMIRWADVVHLTAVYSAPTIPTLLACRLLRKPLTWSPRGALQRWEGATKPLAKRAWESVCNALISRKNCVLHVTSKQEALESESRIPNARIAIVPNGVDIPDALPPKDWLPDGRFRLLYMGRLDPKKGIENLLRALQLLRDDTISLAICGSGDETYSLSLRKLVKQLDLGCCVTFQGHVDGELKSQSFMHADVCVVPSYTENFSMVVAEALAHGIPVIASKGTPWPGLEKHGCGLWIDNSPTALAKYIAIIRSMKLDEMGRRGRTWMQKDLGWESVAKEMITLYRSLIERCHRW